MTNIFLQGFILQASLILALGAQNIFVLNSGLRRERHLLVALLSSLCDMILIFVGVLGVASVFVKVPLFKIGFGILGVLFLFYYGYLKLKEAWSKTNVITHKTNTKTQKDIILATLAFSLLNPHVYLDTVILIGGYSAKFPEATERFFFGLGASTFSFIWFFCLAILASLGNKLIHSEIMMKTISALSGVILLGLSVKLGIEIMKWI